MAESSMLCDAARIGCVLIERVFPTTTWRESTMPNCRRGTTVVDVNLRRWFERTLTEVLFLVFFSFGTRHTAPPLGMAQRTVGRALVEAITI